MGSRQRLSVVFAGIPLITNIGDPISILRMLTVFLSVTQTILFFKYTNDDQSNHSNQRPQHRKLAKEY